MAGVGVMGSRPARACRGWRLRCCRRAGIEADKRQQKAGYRATRHGRGHRGGINVGVGGMGATSLSDLDLRKSGDRQVCVLVVEDDPALQRMSLS
jgi:hypothetical protein